MTCERLSDGCAQHSPHRRKPNTSFASKTLASRHAVSGQRTKFNSITPKRPALIAKLTGSSGIVCRTHRHVPTLGGRSAAAVLVFFVVLLSGRLKGQTSEVDLSTNLRRPVEPSLDQQRQQHRQQQQRPHATVAESWAINHCQRTPPAYRLAQHSVNVMSDLCAP